LKFAIIFMHTHNKLATVMNMEFGSSPWCEVLFQSELCG
jgi:hypothetical protein